MDPWGLGRVLWRLTVVMLETLRLRVSPLTANVGQRFIVWSLPYAHSLSLRSRFTFYLVIMGS